MKKRMLSLALSVVLAVSPVSTAFAAEEDVEIVETSVETEDMAAKDDAEAEETSVGTEDMAAEDDAEAEETSVGAEDTASEDDAKAEETPAGAEDTAAEDDAEAEETPAGAEDTAAEDDTETDETPDVAEETAAEGVSAYEIVIEEATVTDEALMSEVSGTVEGTCGDDVSWELDLDTGVLTLSGSGDTYSYETESAADNPAPWGDYAEYVTSVEIGEGITSIGEYMFCGLENLVSVEIADSVNAIGEGAFWLSGLVSVTIPEGVETLEGSVFGKCTSLKSVSLPQSLTEIEICAFAICTGLESIVIPENVISIGYGAFGYCSGLSIYFEGDMPYINSGAFYNVDITAYYPAGSDS